MQKKMKNIIIITLGISFLFVVSCSPKINYLGDTYSPTHQVDMYFDENDIKVEYKVIGMMKNEANELEIDDVEDVKKAMLKKAREVGADAILFIGFYSERVNPAHHDEIFDNVKKIYEAKLLKYM